MSLPRPAVSVRTAGTPSLFPFSVPGAQKLHVHSARGSGVGIVRLFELCCWEVIRSLLCLRSVLGSPTCVRRFCSWVFTHHPVSFPALDGCVVETWLHLHSFSAGGAQLIVFGRQASTGPSKAISAEILKAAGSAGLKLSHFLTMSVLTGSSAP